MGTQWQEGFVDVRLDSTVDLSSEPLMVPPDRLLRARNVVHDKLGTARMRPPRQEGATVGLVADRVWDLDEAKVYAIAARGSEQFIITQDGLLRHRFDGSAWTLDFIHGLEPSHELRDPNALPVLAARGSVISTSAVDEYAATAHLVHQGYEWFAYRTSGVGGLYLSVRTVDGDEVGTVLVSDAAGGLFELVPTDVAGTSGFVRILWVEASTLRTRVLEPRPDEIIEHNVQSLADDINNALSSFFAVASQASGFGFEIIYGLTGTTVWSVVSYDAANEDVISKTDVYNTGELPSSIVDQPDIILTQSGRIAAAHTGTGGVYLSTMDAVTHASPSTAQRIVGTGMVRCMISRAGSDSLFIAGWVDPPDEEIRAAIIDGAGLAYLFNAGGYTPIARPGEVDGMPVLPVAHTRGSELWSRGITLLTVSPDNFNALGRFVPLARCGIDAGASFAGFFNGLGKIHQFAAGEPRSFAYTPESFGWPQVVRGLTIDNSTRSGFVEANGLTYLPGGEPSAYDGLSHRPATWIEQPLILSVGSGGNGDQIGSTDQHSFRGVWVWIDSTGRAHRSAPGNAATWTPGGVSERALLEVMYPKHTGQYGGYSDPTDSDAFNLFLEIYVQRVGTDGVHKLAWRTQASGDTNLYPASLTSDQVATYDQVSYNAAGASLYTDAGELDASPLPPVAAFELIGDRMWALDAEDRTRVWPSKTLQDGFAFEWNAALVQRVPGERIEAISQISNGRALALRKDGLYIFYGDGPTNGGVGGDFGVPRRVDGAPGCFNGATVVKVPQGVMYQSDSGFHLLRPDLSVIDVSTPLDLFVQQQQSFVAATYSDKDKRAVFWNDDSASEHLVYDTRQGKWSTWLTGEPNLVVTRQLKAAAQLRDGSVAVVDIVDDQTRDNDFVLATYETGMDAPEGDLDLVWRTAWLQPAGLHGRVKWGRVVLTMRKLSDHSLSIRSYTRGDESTQAESVFFDRPEIDAELQGDIYTLEVTTLFPSSRDVNARAIMIEVEVSRDVGGSVGQGASPLAMRVTFSTDGDRRRQQLGSGGRK